MKGGILLSIAHHGDRFTKDIDFSVSGAVADLPVETVIDELRVRLIESVEELEYDVAYSHMNCGRLIQRKTGQH